MKKSQQISQIDHQQSSYEQDYEKEIQNQQIRQLLNSKAEFAQFINKLGWNAKVPLSQTNIRYSKQILSGHFDGEQISLLIENRVQKMIKNHKIKRNWCKQDCTILAWILERTTNGRHLRAPEKLKQNYWQTAAKLIPGTVPEECMFKWLSMKKTKLGNNKWSSNQSRILEKMVKQHGTQDWKKISRELFYQNQSEDKKYRHPKQCRQQWNCYLNPNLKKGPWKHQQDLCLLEMVKRQGRKWSLICKTMIWRTQNALKNRYNFMIQHKKGKYPEMEQENLLDKCLEQLKQPSNHCLNPNQNQHQHQKHDLQLRISLPKAQSKQQITKMEQNSPQHVTIVQCNFQQLRKFMRTNHILIPAKIQKDQLISFEGETEKSFKIKF